MPFLPSPKKSKVNSTEEFEAWMQEFFENAPGAKRNKYVVVLQVDGEPYWYPISRVKGHRGALDIACQAHACSGYPFPPKLNALVYGGSDTPESTTTDRTKWMEFVVVFTPAAA